MTPSYTLAEIADNSREVKPVWLPPNYLGVLTQVRKTFDVSEDLIPSFLAGGQQTAGAAAALDEEQAQIYLREINQIFATQHEFSSLTPVMLDGVTYFLPLIAGHRRHHACTFLNGEIAEGRVARTAKFDGRYRVDLHFGITAQNAIEYQFNENRHAQVPPHEEAEAAWRFWRYRSKHEPSLTVSQFARSLGRTPEWMRSALRFCNLPSDVQSYVTGDNKAGLKFPYGILVDIARLAEGYQTITGEELPQDAYHLWILKAFLGRLNGTQFGRNVSAYLDEKRAEKAGQLSLFSLGEDHEGVEGQRRVRRVVAEHMVRGCWLFLNYFSAVEQIRNAGILGGTSYLVLEENEVPYSPGSPVQMLTRTIGLVEELVPHLAELARLEKRGGSRRLQSAGPFLSEILSGLSALQRLEGQQQRPN